MATKDLQWWFNISKAHSFPADCCAFTRRVARFKHTSKQPETLREHQVKDGPDLSDLIEALRITNRVFIEIPYIYFRLIPLTIIHLLRKNSLLTSICFLAFHMKPLKISRSFPGPWDPKCPSDPSSRSSWCVWSKTPPGISQLDDASFELNGLTWISTVGTFPPHWPTGYLCIPGVSSTSAVVYGVCLFKYAHDIDLVEGKASDNEGIQ